MSLEFGESGAQFNPEQQAALVMSSETLRILRTITEPLIPSPVAEGEEADDLDELQRALGLGMYFRHVITGDGVMLVQATGYFAPEEPEFLSARHQACLPEEYHGLRLCHGGQVDVTNMGLSGVMTRYDLLEIADSNPDLDGGVLIIKENRDYFEGFEEFEGAEKAEAIERIKARISACQDEPTRAELESMLAGLTDQVVAWGSYYEPRGDITLLGVHQADSLAKLLVDAELDGMTPEKLPLDLL